MKSGYLVIVADVARRGLYLKDMPLSSISRAKSASSFDLYFSFLYVTGDSNGLRSSLYYQSLPSGAVVYSQLLILFSHIKIVYR